MNCFWLQVKSTNLKESIIMNRGNIMLFCALGILFFYFLPYLILRQDAYFDPHDSLDSYAAMLTAADKSGDMWNLNPESIVAPIMGGIPRYCFQNNLDFVMVLFSWLPPFTAFLTNLFIVHLIGFLGMYLLLKNHIFQNNKTFIIIPGISLLFAFLPLYPMQGITLSGLPLLIFAFLNILKKQKTKITDYFTIIFFAFYSSFVYVGVFIIIVLIGVLAIDWYIYKKVNKKLFYATCIIGGSYLVFNYFLFYQLFFAKDFISNRIEYIRPRYNYKVALWAAYDILFNGHYHAHSFHFFILLITVPAGIVYGIIKRLHLKPLFFLLFLAVVWACFFGIWQWDVIAVIKEKFTWLNIVGWDRFFFFNPTLWYLIFALSLGLIWHFKIRSVHVGKYFTLFMLFFQMVYIVYNERLFLQNFLYMSEKFIHVPENIKKYILPDHYLQNNTYRTYFQEDMFANVSDYINRPKKTYKVAAIGINTAILQYNGFYTIDGYLTSYPLKYKHKFRKIIEKELFKNDDMRIYFDEWGNRCYLWVAEIWEGNTEIKNLQLNTEPLKEMQCNYIISSAKIINYKDNGMNFLKTFKSPANDLQINLYRIQ